MGHPLQLHLLSPFLFYISLGIRPEPQRKLHPRARRLLTEGEISPALHTSYPRQHRLAGSHGHESGSHAAFLAVLRDTGNTVCGRHPIGVVMAALEALSGHESGGSSHVGESGSESGEAVGEELRIEKGRFRFIRYERSSDVLSPSDSSVSYASAFALL